MKIILAFFVALLCLSSALALATPSTAFCPDNFMLLGGRCIIISTDNYHGLAPARNWTESRAVCTSSIDDTDTWDADLASVDTSFLSIFSSYMVESMPGMKGYIFWVGAQLVDGLWQWTDGSAISNLSYIWHMPLPDSSSAGVYGMLVPSGAFNRFYMFEYKVHSTAPSYVCEAKKRLS